MSALTRGARFRRGRGMVLLGIVAALAAGLLSATDLPRRGWAADPATLDDALPNALHGLPLRLADETPPAPAAAASEAMQGSPEARLLAVYRLIGRGRLDEALVASGALVAQWPHFRLAQLVHADLLAARAGALGAWGGGQGRELPGLLAEAQQRLAGWRARPPAGAVPEEFAHLPAHVPYAIAVDTTHSRLYLFRNGPTGLRLEHDFYVSVGKQGVDKLVEGDQRTPLGIYFTTQHIDASALEDRFGVGALPLNYPNAYDRARGRTGSGILLHGVPRDTYARPPLDSDGCVALANPDLLTLASHLPERDTPVLITRQIVWRAPQPASAGLPPAFAEAWGAWMAARQSADARRLGGFYAPQSTLDRPARSRLQAPSPAKVADTSLITWRDDRELVIVTFREQLAGASSTSRLMRQYWGRDGEDWRIVAEGQVR
ncbi:murein L,D-transpeptidase family protein [Ideonella sp.]|uniref:L,D-transpeptidase family protein n=1 Tax=Ideonella sp. TaxID=1929293 RepID=UPI0035B3D941